MYPYIENPAVARAMADNERRQAESDAAEAQREADKEEAACRRKYYEDEIIKAWVTCDDLGQEDYEKSDQSDFNDFVHNYQIYDLKMKNPLDLGITMPTFQEYQAMKTAIAAKAAFDGMFAESMEQLGKLSIR